MVNVRSRAALKPAEALIILGKPCSLCVALFGIATKRRFLTPKTNSAAEAATENFADLLAESFGEGTNVEGSVVRGYVIGLDGDAVITDVGLKSEGRVPLKELGLPGQQPDVSIGDEIKFMLNVWKTLMVRPYSAAIKPAVKRHGVFSIVIRKTRTCYRRNFWQS